MPPEGGQATDSPELHALRTSLSLPWPLGGACDSSPTHASDDAREPSTDSAATASATRAARDPRALVATSANRSIALADEADGAEEDDEASAAPRDAAEAAPSASGRLDTDTGSEDGCRAGARVPTARRSRFTSPPPSPRCRRNRHSARLTTTAGIRITPLITSSSPPLLPPSPSTLSSSSSSSPSLPSEA